MAIEGPSNDQPVFEKQVREPLPAGDFCCHIMKLKSTNYDADTNRNPSKQGIEIKRGKNEGRTADIIKFELQVDASKHSEYEGRRLYKDLFVFQGIDNYEQFRIDNKEWISFLNHAGYPMDSDGKGMTVYPSCLDDLGEGESFVGLPIICTTKIKLYMNKDGEEAATNDVIAFKTYNNPSKYVDASENNERSAVKDDDDLPF